MAIIDLYSTGKHKQEIGHFANIVKIAKADGEITADEETLIIKVGKNLNITVEESILILINPEKFPIYPPANYDDRIERLYRLSKMVLANGEVKLVEVKLMQKIAIGLRFSGANVEKVCEEAIQLVLLNTALEDFVVAIKKADKS
jgi:uncharacterized tellurite resistance protein B-like protein